MSYIPHSEKAINVGPPVEFLASLNNSGVFCRATVTSHETVIIPDDWFDKWWTVKAKTTDVHILFGDASVAAEVYTATGYSTGTLTFDHNTSFLVEAGDTIQFRVPKYTDPNTGSQAITRFSHIAGDTSGYLLIYVSENP